MRDILHAVVGLTVMTIPVVVYHRLYDLTNTSLESRPVRLRRAALYGSLLPLCYGMFAALYEYWSATDYRPHILQVGSRFFLALAVPMLAASIYLALTPLKTSRLARHAEATVAGTTCFTLAFFILFIVPDACQFGPSAIAWRELPLFLLASLVFSVPVGWFWASVGTRIIRGKNRSS